MSFIKYQTRINKYVFQKKYLIYPNTPKNYMQKLNSNQNSKIYTTYRDMDFKIFSCLIQKPPLIKLIWGIVSKLD